MINKNDDLNKQLKLNGIQILQQNFFCCQKKLWWVLYDVAVTDVK